MRPFGEADYFFSDRRKLVYRLYTAALRCVIVVGALLALFFFGIVSSAF